MKKKFKRKRRIICPNCKTGMDSYVVDNYSPMCPYISCYNGFWCAYYVPNEKVKDENCLSKIMHKIKNLLFNKRAAR